MPEPSDVSGNYRILALSGGGVRGVIPALILGRLEQARPGLLARTTVFAGTSAGGVLALMLATSDDPATRLDDCIWFWQRPDPFGKIQPLALTGAAPVYHDGALRRAVYEVLDPRLRLRDLARCVAVATVELDSMARRRVNRRWWPRVFHNFPTALDELQRRDDWTLANYGLPGVARQPDDDARVVDVAVRTCSFPISLPSYQGYLDGALFANNPSLAALSLVLDHERLLAPGALHPLQNPVGDALQRVRLLSIGTGYHAYFQRGAPSWGVGKWMVDLQHPGRFVDVAADVMAYTINQQCLVLLGADHYGRVNPRLPRNIRLIDAGDERIVPALRRIAARVNLDNVLQWIDQSGWL
jgi:patatin-like phospholipase/acyl hydrolase